MADKQTVRAVRWKPTPYGVMVAFIAANQKPCPTAEDRRHASEVIGKIYDDYHRIRAAGEAVCGAQRSDPAFRTNADLFDATDVPDVLFSPRAWAWLKGALEGFPDVGSTAHLRARVDRSIDDAVEGDVPVTA